MLLKRKGRFHLQPDVVKKICKTQDHYFKYFLFFLLDGYKGKYLILNARLFYTLSDTNLLIYEILYEQFIKVRKNIDVKY